MKFIKILLFFSVSSLFSASLARVEKDSEELKKGIEIFDEHIFSLSNKQTSHSIKVNYQIVEPKINLIAGHSGFLTSSNTEGKGKALYYPEKFCDGFKIEYVNSKSGSSKKYKIILDYFALSPVTSTYLKEENSSIFLNGVNASDFNDTPFISAKTNFAYEQCVLGLEAGTFSLHLFGSSYSLSSGIESILINLGHSKIGIDADSTAHGYLGAQYSTGIGSISKFEVKRRLHNFDTGSFDLHATYGFGSAYTLFEGEFQTIELPLGGQNVEDHKTTLPKSAFITSSSSDITLAYQSTPTKEKPRSLLFAIGVGSKTLQNIDQIEAISSGSAGSISQSFIYIKFGYTS